MKLHLGDLSKPASLYSMSSVFPMRKAKRCRAPLKKQKNSKFLSFNNAVRVVCIYRNTSNITIIIEILF